MTKIVGDGCVTSRTSTEGFGEFYRVRREEGGIPMAWEEGQRPCTASSSPISLSYEEVSYNVYKYIDGRRDREQFVVPLWGAGYWSVHHIVSRGIDILGNLHQKNNKYKCFHCVEVQFFPCKFPRISFLPSANSLLTKDCHIGSNEQNVCLYLDDKWYRSLSEHHSKSDRKMWDLSTCIAEQKHSKQQVWLQGRMILQVQSVQA